MELSDLSQQATAVRARDVTAVEVVSSYLERAADQEDLNAYSELSPEEALASAARIDQDLAAGRDPGPLAGAAIGVKDVIDHAGHVTTAGSAFYRKAATDSATVVSRLEQAGAVIVGRTGLHEFAFGFSSENDWFGPVRNPWDPTCSPGGSSGGSASAVAANLASAAIGTDTGGSIRVPAALCGVVGLKVTHGRVPLTGIFPLAASLDSVGPLARSVADAALVYLAIAGDDDRDPWAPSIPVELPDLDSPIEGLVAGVPQPWVDRAPMSGAVRGAFEQVCSDLEGMGAEVRPVEAPDLLGPGMANEALSPEVASVHRPWFGDRPYGPEVTRRLEEAFKVTLDEYVAAQTWRAGLRNRARDVFSQVDVLITPTVPALRKVIGRNTMDVDGREEGYRFVLSWFTYLVNHMGIPALTLPLASDGAPPPSLQVVGPWWSEARLLEIGAALERAGLSRYRPPPSV